MPKMKTHKSASKRYKVTASGKLVRKQAFTGHLNVNKSSSRKRRLSGKTDVHPSNYNKVLAELPYLKYSR